MNSCCEKCITDKILQQTIYNEFDEEGNCEICQSENVKKINIEKLIDHFEMLLEIYQEDDNGEELYLLFQGDWEIFVNIDVACQLTVTFLPYVSNKRYIRTIDTSQVSSVWEDFKTEIKHNNRFFPNFNSFKLEHFRVWLGELKKENFRKRFLYRARISENGNIIPKDDMGKPPVKLVLSGGRANPIGISYLYTASNKKTAIAEVRPHKGELVTIAKIQIIGKLVLADLRNPRLVTSPFAMPSMETEETFKYISLLEHFSKELSKPVVPREAYLEYLPTQYLSELIKDVGFDGFIFQSSVESGDNVVLFSEENVKIIECELYCVEKVNFREKRQ